jgi:hypothetical protein
MSVNDERLALAKATSIAETVARLGLEDLKRLGRELTGPCPVCGGHDRFSVNIDTNLFNCRICAVGGDQIKLVEHVQGLDFRDALAWLVGAEIAALDPQELMRRKEAAALQAQKRAAYAAKARASAIEAGRRIWDSARVGPHPMIAAYFARRGLAGAPIPPTIRFLPAHAYKKTLAGTVQTLHTGPCMLAAIQNAAGRISAVHQTWIDPEAPSGKAAIAFEGTPYPAKLVRGSKKGGAIRLSDIRAADCLVIGEGIETTLSALVADAAPGAAYWAGVDLGNMAGRQVAGAPGLPDLTDREAFVPPPGLARLIYIQDGDSDPEKTRAKLEAGLRRAQHYHPDLKISIVHAGDGRDLNDRLKDSQQ